MDLRKFIVYSTAGALLWSILLVWAGVQLGDNWVEIRAMLQPFDLAIAVAVVVGFVVILWLRLGRPLPGRRRPPDPEAQ